MFAIREYNFCFVEQKLCCRGIAHFRRYAAYYRGLVVAAAIGGHGYSHRGEGECVVFFGYAFLFGQFYDVVAQGGKIIALVAGVVCGVERVQVVGQRVVGKEFVFVFACLWILAVMSMVTKL